MFIVKLAGADYSFDREMFAEFTNRVSLLVLDDEYEIEVIGIAEDIVENNIAALANLSL